MIRSAHRAAGICRSHGADTPGYNTLYGNNESLALGQTCGEV